MGRIYIENNTYIYEPGSEIRVRVKDVMDKHDVQGAADPQTPLYL